MHPNPSFEVAKRLGLYSSKPRTPSYVFFPDILNDCLERISQVTDVKRVFYSLKANPHPIVVDVIAKAGFGVDVSSAWELSYAIRMGFTPEKITCVGPWKSKEFINAAVDLGVNKISFENVKEAEWLHQNARPQTRLYARVLLIDESLDAGERMINSVSQFGLLPSEVNELISGGKRIDGIHVYGGSDIASVKESCKSLSNAVNIFSESDLGIQFGPGLGISYDLHNADPLWSDLVTSVGSIVGSRRAVDFEIGRYAVAHSAALLAQVEVIKYRADKTICVLNTGITSFARTLITNATHAAVKVGFPICTNAEVCRDIIFCGPTCTPLDTIRTSCYFDTISEGDIVAVIATGAYGVNLNFNNFIGFRRATFRAENDVFAAL